MTDCRKWKFVKDELGRKYKKWKTLHGIGRLSNFSDIKPEMFNYYAWELLQTQAFIFFLHFYFNKFAPIFSESLLVFFIAVFSHCTYSFFLLFSTLFPDNLPREQFSKKDKRLFLWGLISLQTPLI